VASLPTKPLEKPHAKVHDSIHTMLPCLGQNWERDMAMQQAIYGALKDAEEASHEVMELIDRLVREKHGNG
jgi:hypothetical protein